MASKKHGLQFFIQFSVNILHDNAQAVSSEPYSYPMQKIAFTRPVLGLAALIAFACKTTALDVPIRGFIDVLDDEFSGGRERKNEDEDFGELNNQGATTRIISILGTGTPTSVGTGIGSSASSLQTITTGAATGHSQSHSTPISATGPSVASSFTTAGTAHKPTSTTRETPFLAPTGSSVASGAYMPPGEATQWKVIGLVVICIAFVVVTSLLIVFWDAWTGFVKSIICCRRRKGHKELGEEDLIPDWEKGSWEFRLATEDGHRYPTMESLERIARAESGRQGANSGRGFANQQGVGLGVGVGAGDNPFEPQGMGAPYSTSAFLDPHPLEPLTRRPSTNSTKSMRRIA